MLADDGASERITVTEKERERESSVRNIPFSWMSVPPSTTSSAFLVKKEGERKKKKTSQSRSNIIPVGNCRRRCIQCRQSRKRDGRALSIPSLVVSPARRLSLPPAHIYVREPTISSESEQNNDNF